MVSTLHSVPTLVFVSEELPKPHILNFRTLLFSLSPVSTYNPLLKVPSLKSNSLIIKKDFIPKKKNDKQTKNVRSDYLFLYIRDSVVSPPVPCSWLTESSLDLGHNPRSYRDGGVRRRDSRVLSIRRYLLSPWM